MTSDAQTIQLERKHSSPLVVLMAELPDPELHVHNWCAQNGARSSCVLNLPLSECVQLVVPHLQSVSPVSLSPHLLITKEIHEVHLRLSAVASSKDLCT